MSRSDRASLVAIGLAAPAMLLISLLPLGCGNSGASSAAVQEAQYVVPNDEPGTPISDTSFISISDRIPGGRLTSTTASKLTLTDDTPRQIIDGQQIFTKEQYSTLITAPNLRVERIAALSGSVVVLVDVSAESGFPLKSVSDADRDQFVPAPVLHDNIDTNYWPVGFIYKDLDNETLEINIDLSRQFKDLNRIQPLSRSKRQELTLIYQVSRGVNLTGISYGGHEKRTFTMSTSPRF